MQMTSFDILDVSAIADTQLLCFIMTRPEIRLQNFKYFATKKILSSLKKHLIIL